MSPTKKHRRYLRKEGMRRQTRWRIQCNRDQEGQLLGFLLAVVVILIAAMLAIAERWI